MLLKVFTLTTGLIGAVTVLTRKPVPNPVIPKIKCNRLTYTFQVSEKPLEYIDDGSVGKNRNYISFLEAYEDILDYTFRIEENSLLIETGFVVDCLENKEILYIPKFNFDLLKERIAYIKNMASENGRRIVKWKCGEEEYPVLLSSGGQFGVFDIEKNKINQGLFPLVEGELKYESEEDNEKIEEKLSNSGYSVLRLEEDDKAATVGDENIAAVGDDRAAVELNDVLDQLKGQNASSEQTDETVTPTMF